jgi:hypothetical protein
VGFLADLWYLHREAILRVAGVCLLIAAAFVVIAGAPGAVAEPYELGQTAGVLFRNLAIPLIAVATVAYAIQRWYWYDDDASWGRLSPESVAVAGALSLALAVIGGAPGADRSDRELIEATITRGMTTSDPANCDEIYMQALMDQVNFGTGVVAQADCREDEADDDEGAAADSVAISGLAIDDAQARATALLIGGVLDQTTLRLRLVNEQGTWKLDRLLDVDLDRAAFDAAFTTGLMEQGFSEAEASCAIGKFHQRYKLAEIERSAIRGVPGPDQDWGVSCFETSTLRAKLIEVVRESGREREIPADALDCVDDELRALSPEVIRRVYAEPDSDATKGLMHDITGGCMAASASNSAA